VSSVAGRNRATARASALYLFCVHVSMDSVKDGLQLLYICAPGDVIVFRLRIASCESGHRGLCAPSADISNVAVRVLCVEVGRIA